MLDNFLKILARKAAVPTAMLLVTQRLAINSNLLFPFIFLWWAVFWFDAYDVPTLGTFPFHFFVDHFATTIWALLGFTQVSTSLFCACVVRHMNVHGKGRKAVVLLF
jgi:hypothetical protein